MQWNAKQHDKMTCLFEGKHVAITGGGSGIGLFLEADVGHWAAVCSVNYLGVVHTLKAGVPAMVARGAGRVLVTNSTGGFMGAPLILPHLGNKKQTPFPQRAPSV
ncbi:hypothetical protein WJX81_001637 [Elliptochloris bilobata]|uniref:Uncharacterized protein n=1 Tax=Elliptochloris bilobata TaxID=381761 RepID=A0AAW1SCY8_9CHLO